MATTTLTFREIGPVECDLTQTEIPMPGKPGKWKITLPAEHPAIDQIETGVGFQDHTTEAKLDGRDARYSLWDFKAEALPEGGRSYTCDVSLGERPRYGVGIAKGPSPRWGYR